MSRPARLTLATALGMAAMTGRAHAQPVDPWSAPAPDAGQATPPVDAGPPVDATPPVVAPTPPVVEPTPAPVVESEPAPPVAEPAPPPEPAPPAKRVVHPRPNKKRTLYPEPHVQRPLLLPNEAAETSAEVRLGQVSDQFRTLTLMAVDIGARLGLSRAEVELDLAGLLYRTPTAFGATGLQRLSLATRFRLSPDHAVGMTLGRGLDSDGNLDTTALYQRKLHLTPRSAVETVASFTLGHWWSTEGELEWRVRSMTLAAGARLLAQVSDRVAVDARGAVMYVDRFIDGPLAWFTLVEFGARATAAVTRSIDVRVGVDITHTGVIEARALSFTVILRRMP